MGDGAPKTIRVRVSYIVQNKGKKGEANTSRGGGGGGGRAKETISHVRHVCASPQVFQGGDMDNVRTNGSYTRHAKTRPHELQDRKALGTHTYEHTNTH